MSLFMNKHLTLLKYRYEDQEKKLQKVGRKHETRTVVIYLA